MKKSKDSGTHEAQKRASNQGSVAGLVTLHGGRALLNLWRVGAGDEWLIAVAVPLDARVVSA